MYDYKKHVITDLIVCTTTPRTPSFPSNRVVPPSF